MTIEQANQALQVLVNAINIAQKRGAYTLQESSAIYAAIQSFSEPGQENAEVDVEADNTQLEET
tara:strand:+ start:253 stop:444 length:192 start_codon:yes stop_codon:yes gene_type:complete